MAKKKHPLVLVTGGSSGIGLELAKIFAAEGHDVILASSRPARLRRAAEQVRTAGSGHGIKVSTFVADLSKPTSPKRLYTAVKELRRPLDILVNNAGVGVWGDFVRETDLKDEQYDSAQCCVGCRADQAVRRRLGQARRGKDPVHRLGGFHLRRPHC
jgi:short-subunit dehydrogenase